MVRRPFTEEDDKALARYLAEYNPPKSGRSGRRIYEQIERHAAELGSWASAHSAQAWQDRYKRESGRIDVYINRYQNNHGIESTAPQRLLDQDPSRKRARAPEQGSSSPVAAKRPRVEGPSQELTQGLDTSRDSWSKPLPVEQDVVKDEQPSLWDISLQSQAPVQSQAPPTPPRTNSVKSLRESSASPTPRTLDSIPCAQPMPRLTPTSQLPPQPDARDTSLPPSDPHSDSSSPKHKRYPRQYEESPFGRALTASNGTRQISAGGHRATGVEERDLRKGSSPTKSWPPKRSSAQRKNIAPMRLVDNEIPSNADLDNRASVPHPRVPPAAAPRRPQVNAVASSSKVKLPDAARLSPRTANRILASNSERAASPPPRRQAPPPAHRATSQPLRRASTPILSSPITKQPDTPRLVAPRQARVHSDEEQGDAASERPVLAPHRADKRKRHMPPPPAARSDDDEEVNVPAAPKGKHARRSGALAPVNRTHKRRQTFASFGKDARSGMEVARPRKSLQIETGDRKRRKSMLEPASQSYLSQLRRSGIILPRSTNASISDSETHSARGDQIYLSVGRAIVRRDLSKKYGFEVDVVENVLDSVDDDPVEAERVLREMREAAVRAYRRSLGLVGSEDEDGSEEEEGDEKMEDVDMDSVEEDEDGDSGGEAEDEADEDSVQADVQEVDGDVHAHVEQEEDADEQMDLGRYSDSGDEVSDAANDDLNPLDAYDHDDHTASQRDQPASSSPPPRRRHPRVSAAGLHYTPISPGRTPYSPPPHTHARTYTRLSNSGRVEEAKERLMSSPAKRAGTSSPMKSSPIRALEVMPRPLRLRPASASAVEEEDDFGDQDPFKIPYFEDPPSQPLPKSSQSLPKSSQSIPKSSQRLNSPNPAQSSPGQLKIPNAVETTEIKRWMRDNEVEKLARAEKVYDHDALVRCAMEWVCEGYDEEDEDDDEAA